ncbi:xanthine dehydrogenase small subunit [Massilia eurypsychrophila]|jgi:xanthine dehydrogenase small subunit|uniref:Xanthine dehydrogenase small subunit n=1 Tax=Massilia eurypsychrophila TaxID=1485217 RepID=A0A2G8TI30_9BURK|nr:xanthine dehydrogenase small subunit [Massilia eurypsychrophila]PIL45288.1 xanthine dehydrogenase small subunit [Massilia eurypsychrophila]
MSDPIRFYFQGKVRQLDGVAPTRTVLQHLREDLHCTGTKEGCAEGDCGACTVVIGSLENGALELKAVNSCIQFAATLDGKALFSVEDLQQPDGALHPVQQAMVECHGSQCGFCTPGFVMSLWGMYLKQDLMQENAQPSRRQVDDALSGNLCRCTGYRPIIDAARRMGELPPVAFDRAALAAQLLELRRDSMATYSAGGASFFAPRTLDELTEVRAAHPAALLLAGSTDIGLWVTKQLREIGDIIYLGHVDALKAVTEAAGFIDIGAGVTLEDAYRAVCKHYPDQLSEMWQRFASLPIRNAGTLGGNVANGSPIGDSMPWLIALGAELVLRGPAGVRAMPLEAFYLGYQKKDLQAGEFVQAVRVPMPRAGVQFRTYKLAKRFDQDISAVCAAFALRIDGGVVAHARIAFGGMAATPQRAARTEALLQGRQWSEATLREAMAMLAVDYAPLSDMRASSGYRMKAAQNLLRRFWFETRTENPLAPADVNAFARRIQGASA